MNKVWINREKGDDKVIAIIDDTIYKASPPDSDLDNFAWNLEQKIFPSDIFKISFEKLRRIRMEEGKNYLQLFFSKGYYEEHFKVKNDERRWEIYEHFKNNIPYIKAGRIKLTKFQAAKKPLIALAFIVSIYGVALALSFGMDNGLRIEAGGGYSALAVALGSLGVFKLSLIFGALATIAIRAIFKRINAIPEILILFFD